MTVGKIIRALAASLRTKFGETGCEVSISGTPEDTAAALASLPNKWRIVLQLAGLSPAGNSGGRGRETTLAVVIQQGDVLSQTPGEGMALERVDDLPMTDLIETVDEYLTTLIFSTSLDAQRQHPEIDGMGLRFVSGNWLVAEGVSGAFGLEYTVRYTRPGLKPGAAAMT